AGRLAERADQDLLGEELHADEDFPELAAPLLLLRERGLELELGDHACLDEQVADPDPHPIILREAKTCQQLPGISAVTALPRPSCRGGRRGEKRRMAAVFRR